MSVHRLKSPAALVAALAASLMAPSPGLAATWQVEPIPQTAGASAPSSFAFDRQDRALLLFEAIDAQRSRARFTGLALRAPDGTWSRTGDLQGIGWGSAQAHPYARTRVLLVTRQVTGFGRFNRASFRLVWGLGRTEGGFGKLREIAGSADVPASAVNDAGDAVVAFSPQRQTGVQVSERRAGKNFGRPRSLAGGTSWAPAVALNARGDRVVAWFRGDRVEARVRRAGEDWGAVRTLGRLLRGADASLRALVTPSGRFAVAWHTWRVREEQPSQIEAGVAIRTRTGAWHGALLERSVLGDDAMAAQAAAVPLVDTAGNVLVAWTGRWREGTGVRVARISSSARINGPILVSGEAQVAALDDAAAGPAGRVAVTYAEAGTPGASRTWIALGSARGFAAPDPLTPEGEAGLAGSRVAYSRLTGRVAVVRPVVQDGRGALVAASAS